VRLPGFFLSMDSTMDGKTVLMAVLAGLALIGVGWAEMMPMSDPECGSRPLADPEVGQRKDPDSGRHSSDVYRLMDPYTTGVGFLPISHADGELDDPARPTYILDDRNDSFRLCLCALLSLGLCKAVPLVKRLSITFAPDWPACGGPFQIGHSLTLVPDYLGHPVICFVQPQRLPERLKPQDHRGILSPLLRKSQFALTILGARGPPLTS
jgi:hypothetical protein